MRHAIPVFTFFLSLIAIIPGLFAQGSEKEPLHFQTYTIEDGLSDNWIRDVSQDSRGYLWIATNSGISRYDGYEFEIFRNDPGDSTTLSSNDITQIFADRDDNIWAGTTFGLNLYDRFSDTFTSYRNDPSDSESLPGNSIRKIYESTAGDLWIGTTQGVALYDKNHQSFKNVLVDTGIDSTSSRPEVTSITESDDGLIWIGTYGGGVYIYNPQTREITNLRHDPDDPESLPSDFIFNVFIDRDQVLWVSYDRRENKSGVFLMEDLTPGSRSGLWNKNLVTDSTRHFLYNPEKSHPLWALVSKVEQTDDGKLWFTQYGGVGLAGLTVYDVSTDSFFGYPYDPTNSGSIAWNYATSVYEDRFRNLWLATSRGLSKANRNQIRMESFIPIRGDQYNLQNNLYAIEEVENNRFWIAGDGSDNIIDWNRKNGTWKELSNIRAVGKPLLDEDGRHLWYISTENLNAIERVDIHTLEKESFDFSAKTSDGFTLYQFIRYSDDTLLFTTNQGLWEFNIDSGELRSLQISELPDVAGSPFDVNFSAIPNLVTDSSGKVWFTANNVPLDSTGATLGILVLGYDPVTGETIAPAITDSYIGAFGNGRAQHISLDSRRQLWISKTNGLVRYDPETGQSTFYNQNDGLRHLWVLGTLEDNQGIIWISTNYGISRLNPDTGKIRNYGQDDGLEPSRMNPFSFYKRENGELLFGGVGGISYFMPEDIQDVEDPPLIHVVNLQAGDSRIHLDTALTSDNATEIEWDANSIDIEYISVNFSNPGETIYSYKLDGFHDDWVEAGSRRNAQFSNLPPGRYRFDVRAVNANEVTSVETASVLFVILPPWWRTWLAYLFYALIFAAGVFALARVQKRRVLYKEKERAREKELKQAKEIEKAYENLKAAQEQLIQQEKLASLGQLTAGIAHEIKNPLNFVNNFSDLSIELVEEIREELRQRTRDQSHLRQVSGGQGKTKNEKGENPLSRGDSSTSPDTDLILEILKDIETNLRTIHKHGSRADSIVKSMLQHSGGGDGTMEPTALNPLIKEYVNLSFHGMRAGKNPIDVDIDLQLDKSVGEVPLIAEDFSRVILNLCNNAFDAMREKLANKDLQGFQNRGGLDDYQPKLTIRTHQSENTVTVEIEDNGPGIPVDIKDKIMQPFFTTKKGTEGTGLGLSITHDIVKAHGGKIDISSIENATIVVVKLNNQSKIGD
jgi:signal transduction histidine kinase/ligand-binding sensor domain-containing protein